MAKLGKLFQKTNSKGAKSPVKGALAHSGGVASMMTPNLGNSGKTIPAKKSIFGKK